MTKQQTGPMVNPGVRTHAGTGAVKDGIVLQVMDSSGGQ